MASNRLRSIRNVGTRLNKFQSDMSTVRRRPSPRKLATNLILEGNLRRYVATEPIVAPNAITNEKIDDGAVDTGEIADDAVTEDKLDIDAVTGKNITSCQITDSDIDNCRLANSDMQTMTFAGMEGTELTVTSTFSLTSGTIAEVEITGPSTLTGSDVVLDGVDLVGVTADVITGTGGGMTIIADPLGVQGSFVVDGSTTMTVGGGAFGVTVGGTGISLAAGSINIDAGSYENVSFNGQTLTPMTMFENEVADIYQEIAAVEAQVAALGSCACP